jgi:CRP-like cAMP-binding protein
VFLTESASSLTEGTGFLDRLTAAESQAVQAEALKVRLPAGAQVFAQGDPHQGIWLIRNGIIRTYYVAPSDCPG